MSSHLAEPDVIKQSTVAVGSAGLLVGAILSGIYVLWALFIVSGLAQSLMDWVAALHFINPVYVVQHIDLSRLASLVLLTGALGYALGGLFALLCNRVNHPRIR